MRCISNLAPQGGAFTGARGANFNLLTGVTSLISSGVTATINPLPDGWYRCSISATATGTGSARVIIYAASSTGTGTGRATIAVGDGSSGIYLWGALFNGQTLQFTRSPARPARSLNFTQPAEASTGWVRFGYDLYCKNDIMDVPLRMTGTEKTSFIAFFRDTARGMANPFTYVDPVGMAFSVRFASSQLPEIIEKAYDTYTATVRLRLA